MNQDFLNTKNQSRDNFNSLTGEKIASKDLKEVDDNENLDFLFNYQTLNYDLNLESVRSRNKHIIQMNKNCIELMNMDNTDRERLSDFFKSFPKCMVHQTRKICNCKTKCIKKILPKRVFEEKCPFYDLNQFYNDNSYIPRCDLFNPIKNIDADKSKNDESDRIKKRLNKEIVKLCNDKKYFNEVKCLAYELRDVCENDKKCMTFQGSKKNLTCKNLRYEHNVRKLEDICNTKIRILTRNAIFNQTDNFNTVELSDPKFESYKEVSGLTSFGNTLTPFKLSLYILGVIFVVVYNRKSIKKLTLYLSVVLMSFIIFTYFSS